MKDSIIFLLLLLFLFQLTVVASVSAGILLIVAPEEPSLQLGGGHDYALVPGMFLIGVAVCTMLAAVMGLCAVTKDSSCGLLAVSLLPLTR